jgi:threonine dehydrogenase-like Zn-dependent dehydrogenase
MRGAILYGPRDVRFEERAAPTIIKPTDAVIRISATCICGSELWPYRGISPVTQPTPMGHEYCGIIEEVGNAVASFKPGQFVIGSFFASDNTCPHCQAGYQTSCQPKEFISTSERWTSNLRPTRAAASRERQARAHCFSARIRQAPNDPESSQRVDGRWSRRD